MPRRLLAVVLVASACVAAGVACSSFGSSSSDAPPADAGTIDGAADGPEPESSTPADGAVSCATMSEDPQPFATTDAGPTVVATDDKHVYWGGDRLERAPIGGGDIEPVGETGPGRVSALTVTAAMVVYLRGDYMWSVDKTQPTSAGYHANGWAPALAPSVGNDAFAITADGIYGIPFAGPAYYVAANMPAPTAVDQGAGLVVAVGASGDGGIGLYTTVDSAHGETARLLDLGGRRPARATVDVDGIYFTDPEAGEVVAANRDGGALRVLSSGHVQLGDIRVRDQLVYFSTAKGIRRVATSGGCTAVLSKEASPSLALGPTQLFFIAGGNVVQVPR